MNFVGAAIQIESTDEGVYDSPVKLNINGGSYTSEKNSAIVINGWSTEDAGIEKGSAITGDVTLVSGTDESTGDALPAISLLAQDDEAADKLLANLEGFAVGVEVDGDLVGSLTIKEGGSRPASVVNAALTKATEGGTGSEGQTPGEGQIGTEGEGSGNQGSTENVKNPETNDNILVYAGLGLVSLASVAFTARKRED